MSKEINLKKVDGLYIGVIPAYGLLVKAPSAEEVYGKLEQQAQVLEAEWKSAGLIHLLEAESGAIRVHKLEKKLKNFILLSLVLYFAGLVALGLVIKNSAERIKDSLSLITAQQSPERQEKALNNFKKTLEIYRPYIKELQKVLNEKDSDRNR